MKKALFLTFGLLLVAGAGVGAWQAYRSSGQVVAFRKVTVERGELAACISATGTIEPEEVVDVGAQVAARIIRFGQDPRDSSKAIDYGSPVEEGTVLAQLDDALYAAEVDQATSLVGQGDANIARANADLLQAQAKFHQTERDYTRARKLGPTSSISQLDFDTAQASYETARAGVVVAEAAVLQAKQSAAGATASLKKARTNLSYCTIKSPVKGVIVDRRVNVGQTVVASLNAPSLFLIAKDLKRLQVWASVNEADIGKIYPGQMVHFGVDAHPNEEFTGLVGQIRLNASMTQNVVTYTVVVNADNTKNKLLPYLTANLQFEVSKRTDVLRAPNAALRWKPQPQFVTPEFRAVTFKPRKQRGADGERDRGTVWVTAVDGLVRPLKVKLGLSDGVLTEISGEEIEEGLQVVAGIEHGSPDQSGSNNPFAPQMSSGRKPQ